MKAEYLIPEATKHSLHPQRKSHHFARKITRFPQALIVEDDVDSVRPLQLALYNFGFETTVCFDGREAIDQMSRRHFDLVFLDIGLPEKNGLQVLSEVKNLTHTHRYSNRWRNLPIVTYSSKTRSEFQIPREDGFYIVGHWQKPMTLPDLAMSIRKTMDQLGLTPGTAA